MTNIPAPDSISLGNIGYPLDFRGYLTDHTLWSPRLMEWFADREQVALTEEHVGVLQFIRSHFEKYKVHPTARSIAAFLAETGGSAKGTVKYFHSLFPKGVHQAYRIAGLPRIVQSV